MTAKAFRFASRIEIIGVNPFVHPPQELLEHLFEAAGRNRGPIPVRLEIAGESFPQTLVKFAGCWRLYLNGPMLRAAGKGVGDPVEISVAFDPVERVVAMRPELQAALDAHPGAKEIFVGLPSSRRKEIVRYIASLKGEDAIARNVERAILFLEGKTRFVGRDHP